MNTNEILDKLQSRITPEVILQELDTHSLNTSLRDIILNLSVIKTTCPACSLLLFIHVLASELWVLGFKEKEHLDEVFKRIADIVPKIDEAHKVKLQ